MALAALGSDAYKWMLAFHILAAVTWIGSAIAIQVFIIRARAAGPDRLSFFASEVEWYGMRFLTASSLVLVLFGFALLHESSGAYNLGTTWVMIGFVVWALSFLTGISYLGPESGRLSKMVEERGPEDPEYLQRLSRIFIVSRIELALLIVIVFDMVIKPFS